MKKNMGSADSISRLVLATVIVILFFTKVVTGTLGIISLVFAGILVITSFFRFCPLYLPFGINTCKKPD